MVKPLFKQVQKEDKKFQLAGNMAAGANVRKGCCSNMETVITRQDEATAFFAIWTKVLYTMYDLDDGDVAVPQGKIDWADSAAQDKMYSHKCKMMMPTEVDEQVQSIKHSLHETVKRLSSDSMDSTKGKAILAAGNLAKSIEPGNRAKQVLEAVKHAIEDLTQIKQDKEKYLAEAKEEAPLDNSQPSAQTPRVWTKDDIFGHQLPEGVSQEQTEVLKQQTEVLISLINEVNRMDSAAMCFFQTNPVKVDSRAKMILAAQQLRTFPRPRAPSTMR